MGFIKDVKLNRNPGQVSFFLHRVTGVALALYLILHIIFHSTALFMGPGAYDRLLSILENPFGRFLELMTVLAVVIHMSNGVRLLLIDFFNAARWHRRLIYLAAYFALIFMGYAVWVKI